MIEPERHGAGSSRGVGRFAHDAMACSFGLWIRTDDGKYAEQAARAAFDEIDELERHLSRFIPHSDVGRINRLEPGRATRVTPATRVCLERASALYVATEGAFDVGFRGKIDDQGEKPAAGGPPLVFDPEAHAVGVQRAGVELDLGGIGKGYALDRVAALLREWSLADALVHSGASTVVAIGQATADECWQVALRDPVEPERERGVVELADFALSGSGQVLHGGHIRAPRTGAVVEHFAAAWAIAPDALTADALSTAFMVLDVAGVERVCGRLRSVSAILLPAGEAAQPIVLGPHADAVRWR